MTKILKIGRILIISDNLIDFHRDVTKALPACGLRIQSLLLDWDSQLAGTIFDYKPVDMRGISADTNTPVF